MPLVHVLALLHSTDISSFKFDLSTLTPQFDVFIGTILNSGLMGGSEDAASKDEMFDVEYPGDNERGADGSDTDSDKDSDGQDDDGDGEAIKDVVTGDSKELDGVIYIQY
ncbi:hypothetical protein F5141DRAFT_1068957 [Pisolithus sp. B1]|nr:hypothetical protein F5141DRAFT_1068957 [Pisolithus sp. B1]